MKPYYEEDGITIYHGDCRDVMRQMEPDSIDSVVCDPPYGMSFMNKGWDHAVPGVDYWTEVFRVLKPGGHLLAFGGTRLYHRLTCAVEDSGFEIRDCLSWIYGSGFPKSLDVSKAIDKVAGAERSKIKYAPRPASSGTFAGASETRPCFEKSRIEGFLETVDGTPITPEAAKWDGWGTALKPSWEPIILARKPFKGTVTKNVLEHGTGAINIDGCRIETNEYVKDDGIRNSSSCNEGYKRPNKSMFQNGKRAKRSGPGDIQGRWPANLVHDGSEEVIVGFPETESGARKKGVRQGMGYHGAKGDGGPEITASSGSASRFFYCAKPSKEERSKGNNHPTVKPVLLMRWLCRMVTPAKGIILDPFTGSGTTLGAAKEEGFRAIGIDLKEKYCKIASKRFPQGVLDLF